VLLHAVRKTGKSRWCKEDENKSITSVKLHFVKPPVLLDVNRKFDRSRGSRGRRMNNTAVNPSFVICQLFNMSFQEGGEHRKEEKLGESYC
jgi:hypothetical protein